MAMSATTYGRFDIPRVLNRMFKVIAGDPVTFIGLSLLLTLPVVAINVWTTMQSGMGGAASPALVRAVSAPGGMVTILTGIFIGFVIYMIFAALLQGAITHGTIVALNGRKASLGECLSTGAQHALPLFAISILASLGILLGFVLLVVPGLMLAMAWAVLAPVRVAERTPIMETFGRCADLTSGYRWQIFLLVIIYAVLSMVIQMVFLPFIGMTALTGSPGSFSLAFVVLQAIQRTLQSLFSATGIASIYYELRTVKEGVGPEQLASVFA